jgi:hypothetical protein
VERVERELGFDEVVFDPPSQTLVDLTAVLFGQEVFHQLVLQELLALTDLGQRLGIWSHTQPPAVVSEPRRGLFDLGLAQFAVGVERPIEVYLELKVGSHLEADQFEQQLEGAADVQRVYLLLGSTYFRWRHAGTATFIGVTELAAAITAIGAKYTGTPGEIARVYGARLSEEAERWSQTMDPTHTWDALDYFRFYAEVAPTWPVEVNIYPVTNRSGQQYVLNAPSSWSTPTGPEWQDGQVYWELVNGRLRYKLQWDGASGARLGRRRAWQEALRGAALERGEELHQPRSSHGRAMTVAELGGDIREVLIHEGSVDVQRSRDLYDRASRLFDLAVRRLELATP